MPLERPLHSPRHSYGRALRRVEAPLEAVQAALDHSNLATTSIYLRQLEGQEDPWWPKLARELGSRVGERRPRLPRNDNDGGRGRSQPRRGAAPAGDWPGAGPGAGGRAGP